MSMAERSAESPRGDLSLEVRDLHTYFRTSEGVMQAVRGVSFGVERGGSLGIVGESGSGKSVTSLSVMRLIEPPGFIPRGEVYLDGRDLLQLTEGEMERIRGTEVAMVFQDPVAALNPVYPVGRQVTEAIRAHQPLNRSAAEARAIELLDMVGIAAPRRTMREYPHRLSGGMCQRVVIAMALANDPHVLILDEPTTALDATIQAQILEVVRNLRAQFGTATLLITHDIAVINEVSDNVAVMYGGRVMEQGTVQQVVGDPKHPYSRELMECAVSVEKGKDRLYTIPGEVPSLGDLPTGCPFASRCPKAFDRCRAEMPDCLPLSDGRQVACWLYDSPSA